LPAATKIARRLKAEVASFLAFSEAEPNQRKYFDA
jgi:hypothetical protein